jgi:hypothetical protein
MSCVSFRSHSEEGSVAIPLLAQGPVLWWEWERVRVNQPWVLYMSFPPPLSIEDR